MNTVAGLWDGIPLGFWEKMHLWLTLSPAGEGWGEGEWPLPFTASILQYGYNYCSIPLKTAKNRGRGGQRKDCKRQENQRVLPHPSPASAKRCSNYIILTGPLGEGTRSSVSVHHQSLGKQVAHGDRRAQRTGENKSPLPAGEG